MIKVNGEIVEIGNFPDGTILMKQGYTLSNKPTITWNYENDRELVALIYLTKHLRRLGWEMIDLVMPYIPNARQDRVKNPEDIFTLKYFSEIINSLNFRTVNVLDPHSTVSEALINNIHIYSAKPWIDNVLQKLDVGFVDVYNPMTLITTREYSLTMFYPDEGAMKRYAGMVNLP